MAVKSQVLDFTNVKEGGGRFNRAHRTPGDYLAKITKVEFVKTKDGGKPMWLFTIKQGAGSYPYYCQFAENVLWKVRSLFAAAGVSIPSKKVNLNPNRVVNKAIGISLDDHEYDGRMMSEIIAVFSTSELSGHDPDEDEEEGEEEDEEDEEEEDETEEEEDDEEDEEEEPPPPPKKSKKDKSKQKTRRKTQVKDEELEELDIEDV
jgi:hypothetical protein